MTRETKVGLVVAGSFLVLVGVVIAARLRQSGSAPAANPDEAVVAQANAVGAGKEKALAAKPGGEENELTTPSGATSLPKKADLPAAPQAAPSVLPVGVTDNAGALPPAIPSVATGDDRVAIPLPGEPAAASKGIESPPPVAGSPGIAPPPPASVEPAPAGSPKPPEGPVTAVPAPPPTPGNEPDKKSNSATGGPPPARPFNEELFAQKKKSEAAATAEPPVPAAPAPAVVNPAPVQGERTEESSREPAGPPAVPGFPKSEDRAEAPTPPVPVMPQRKESALPTSPGRVEPPTPPPALVVRPGVGRPAATSPDSPRVGVDPPVPMGSPSASAAVAGNSAAGVNASTPPPLGSEAPVSSPPIRIATGPTGPRNPVDAGAPQVRSYDVRSYTCTAEDRTLADVARKAYGNEKYGRALLLFNREHPLAAPNVQDAWPQHRLGQADYLPPKEVLEARFASALNEPLPPAGPPSGSPVTIRPPMPVGQVPGNPATARPAPPTGQPRTAPTADATRRYVVAGQGEMVYEIARDRLGDGRRWPEIYRLNPSIRPESRIPPGTELRLPVDARVQ